MCLYQHLCEMMLGTQGNLLPSVLIYTSNPFINRPHLMGTKPRNYCAHNVSLGWPLQSVPAWFPACSRWLKSHLAVFTLYYTPFEWSLLSRDADRHCKATRDSAGSLVPSLTLAFRYGHHGNHCLGVLYVCMLKQWNGLC